MNELSLGDWISFGQMKKAVVCRIYDKENIEVMYLDDRDRAINEDMVLVDDKWKFKIQGPNGGYADKYPRLSEYVRILRAGQNSCL